MKKHTQFYSFPTLNMHFVIVLAIVLTHATSGSSETSSTAFTTSPSTPIASGSTSSPNSQAGNYPVRFALSAASSAATAAQRCVAVSNQVAVLGGRITDAGNQVIHDLNSYSRDAIAEPYDILPATSSTTLTIRLATDLINNAAWMTLAAHQAADHAQDAAFEARTAAGRRDVSESYRQAEKAAQWKTEAEALLRDTRQTFVQTRDLARDIIPDVGLDEPSEDQTGADG